MMGPDGGLRDPRVLQHTAQKNASKIADLDCDQASPCPEPRAKAERHCRGNALSQNNSHKDQERSHGEHRPRNRSGDKM
jgi:hypothetical protein